MREKMKKILVGFFVCFALFGLGTAHAGTIDSGTPYPGNSTDQNWYENGISNSGANTGPVEAITQIQMEVTGAQFDTSPNAGILNFTGTSTASSWSQTVDTGTILVADGNAFNPNDLYFTTALQGTYIPIGTTIMYQGYDVINGVGTLVDSCELVWNGTWIITNVSYTPGLLDPPAPAVVTGAVPEPSCLLLLGGGLVGLAVISKRFRKA
jgi:hypothetical protein